MTKKEKIQEAYGEYWETVKDYVDENGFINEEKVDWLFNESEIEQKELVYMVNGMKEYVNSWRPKSLQGIENNNGWTKIESEDDLLKESGEYWTAIGESPDEVFYNEFVERKYFKWRNIEVTHYQPIQKPQPPIY